MRLYIVEYEKRKYIVREIYTYFCVHARLLLGAVLITENILTQYK